MIKDCAEFMKLRESDNLDDQYRAGHDEADVKVWLDIIENYPEFKKWVVNNKTIQIEVLEILCIDKDSNIRAEVARKRKINDKIFSVLSHDSDENVRYALMCNTKLTIDKKRTIKVNDSKWLAEKLNEMEKNACS
jgi:hypothetical protein